MAEKTTVTEKVIVEKEVKTEKVKPTHSEAVSKGMLEYHGRKARIERDKLAEKNKKLAAQIRSLKRKLKKANLGK